MFNNSKLIIEVRKNNRGSHFLIELFKYFFVIFTISYFANSVNGFIVNHSNKPFVDIPGLWNFSMFLMAVGAILYCLVWEKMSLRQIGTTYTGPKQSIVTYSLGLGYGSLTVSLVAVLVFLIKGLSFSNNISNVKWFSFFIILISYLVQGFGEEVLFRGAFLLSTVRKNNPIIAIVITSVYFSLWHYHTNSYGIIPFINLFFFGVFCSVCVFVYDNIWVASAFHAAWNFTQAHVFGVCVSGSTPNADSTILISTVSGSSVLTGGNYGIEGSLITSIILGIGIVALVFYDKLVRKRKVSVKEPSL
jgi:membrane protease YdiL (CAAX protease family)